MTDTLVERLEAVSNLLELAARCEAATGADRELDEAICAALGWTRSGTVGVGSGIYNPDGNWRDSLPSFTASIDAALTLVPEGWFIILDELGGDGLPLATLHTPQGMRKEIGIGRNLTLALCAAALKARANG